MATERSVVIFSQGTYGLPCTAKGLKNQLFALCLYITVTKTHVKSRRFCRLFCDGILPILEGVLRT